MQLRIFLLIPLLLSVMNWSLELNRYLGRSTQAKESKDNDGQVFQCHLNAYKLDSLDEVARTVRSGVGPHEAAL